MLAKVALFECLSDRVEARLAAFCYLAALALGRQVSRTVSANFANDHCCSLKLDSLQGPSTGLGPLAAARLAL